MARRKRPQDEGSVVLDLKFSETKPIAVLDLSAFLFDANRLYAVAFKAERDPYHVDEEHYRGYGRNSFRVPQAYQLRVPRLRFESPGEIVLAVAVGAIGAVWTVMQIVEKAKLWPLQQEKLRLEVEKLRDEADTRRIAGAGLLPLKDGTYEGRDRVRAPREPGARVRIEPVLNLPVTKSAINQLSHNPLKPVDLAASIRADISDIDDEEHEVIPRLR